ncbi:UNVERIFIED_CONTAM: hypothetical protein FKN15_036268 [Acipenser sinensis]
MPAWIIGTTDIWVITTIGDCYTLQFQPPPFQGIIATTVSGSGGPTAETSNFQLFTHSGEREDRSLTSDGSICT